LLAGFHLLTAPSEYGDEAALYRQLLESMGPIRTVLEPGSGGGNNASHPRASAPGRAAEVTVMAR